MRCPEANILIGSTPQITRGAFEVHHIEGEIEEPVIEVKQNILFKARGSLGEDYIAGGVVFREISKGRKVLLVRHPEDRFKVIE